MAVVFSKKQKERDQSLGITFKDSLLVTYCYQPGPQLFNVLQNPKIAHSRNKLSSRKLVGTF